MDLIKTLHKDLGQLNNTHFSRMTYQTLKPKLWSTPSILSPSRTSTWSTRSPSGSPPKLLRAKARTTKARSTDLESTIIGSLRALAHSRWLYRRERRLPLKVFKLTRFLQDKNCLNRVWLEISPLTNCSMSASNLTPWTKKSRSLRAWRTSSTASPLS